ncbi:hypothetical protein HC000_08530 [Pseudoalteromonas sp. MIP2626]|uniref:hypothetical protein n=1 Tax=Pseudoalteromonas sp. MIP2626 TaxID=2705464 RepID=UPI0015CC63D1|nr:hypothetical protein [Pseudoalteromonas sp. MIP2626]NYR12538.1 hypothetical protein [Pseudoalteromonas sp. MIP2626]
MARLLGKLTGLVIQLLILPFVIIFAIPAGLMKARRAQAARILFTRDEQTLLSKAQGTLNMAESALVPPDNDLLITSKCIENARVQYQQIKGTERFDTKFSNFLAPQLLKCRVNDWSNVSKFFNLSNLGIQLPNQVLGETKTTPQPNFKSSDWNNKPAQEQPIALPYGNDKKLQEITECVVVLTTNALSHTDLELTESNANSLVKTIMLSMRESFDATTPPIISALQVVENLAENARNNQQYDFLCMFAISVIVGGEIYVKENTLSEKESKFILEMINRAHETIAKHKKHITSKTVIDFINTSLVSRKKAIATSKNNGYYIRDTLSEQLNQPIHIHFDSYEPVFNMRNKVLPNPCTFLVTIDSPNFSPKGLTCRVGGINHKHLAQDKNDEVIAHVYMAKEEYDGSFKRVHVQLLEDGRVVGQLVNNGQYEKMTSLDGVFFLPGDTVFLDEMGEPYHQDDQPETTKEQQLLLDREMEQIGNSYFE